MTLRAASGDVRELESLAGDPWLKFGDLWLDFFFLKQHIFWWLFVCF